MKVLLLTDGIIPYVTGGMQKHSYMVAKYLARQGVKIELHHFTLHSDEKKHSFSTEAIRNITLIEHKFPRLFKFPGHYVISSFLYSRLVFKSIKNRLGDFDFIYTKGFAGWELLRKKHKIKNCPKIGVKFHGMNMFLPTFGLKQKLEQFMLRPPAKWVMKNSDVVFSYGGKVTETIIKQGISSRKIFEIPTGIEKDWIRKSDLVSKQNRKFVYVGRYDPVKGIRELDKAIQKVKGAFEFHFVGPFDNGVQLKRPNVFYHGKIKNPVKIKNLLDEMDVLVLPSYSEGMPNVILEAMARGCAILATDVGAVSALVSTENGKLLWDSSTESIISGLNHFIAMPDEKLKWLKKNAIETVEQNFTWEYIATILKQKLAAIK